MLTQKDVKKQVFASKNEYAGESQKAHASGALPNSAMAGMLGMPDTSSQELDEGMRSRLSGFMNNQIGTAEREAERVAACVSSTASMDEVKAQVGARMGADFSGVRFHEGGSDEAMATGIGARAYTVGSDVYFGAGGFDPQVAAHELAHTVQQGAIEGTAAVSAPMGGVQMRPFSSLKNLFGGNKKKSLPKLKGDGAAFSNAVGGMDPAAQADELQKMRLYLQQKKAELDPNDKKAKLSGRDASLQKGYDQTLYQCARNPEFRNALMGQTRKAADKMHYISTNGGAPRKEIGVSDEAFDLDMYNGLTDDTIKSLDFNSLERMTFAAQTVTQKSKGKDDEYAHVVGRGLGSLNTLRTYYAKEPDVAKARAAKNLRYTPAGLDPEAFRKPSEEPAKRGFFSRLFGRK